MPTAQAAVYAGCELLGVVEDVLPYKVHFRPLKVVDDTIGGYDPNRLSCMEMKETVIPIYDDVERIAGEVCHVVMDLSLVQSRYRPHLRDVIEKGDMLTFDYSYVVQQSEEGNSCSKSWRLKEHVPIRPHSR